MNTRTNELYEIVDGQPMDAVIRVIGVGGGGCNSVNEMVTAQIEGVELIAANTDRKHLERCKTTNILQLGPRSSRGLGAGSDPGKGKDIPWVLGASQDNLGRSLSAEQQALKRLNDAQKAEDRRKKAERQNDQR